MKRIIVTFVIILFLRHFVFVPSTTTVPQASSSNVISTVHTDVNMILDEDQQFSLPTQTVAKMDDNNDKVFNITWDKGTPTQCPVDGSITCIGHIQGYAQPLKYTFTVLPDTVTSHFYTVMTSNSKVIYKNVDVGSDWVWFKIYKDGHIEDQFLKTDNGMLNGTLYLHFGPGQYSIHTLTSDSSQEYGTYYDFRNFVINNNDKRDMSYLLPTSVSQSDSAEIRKLAADITRNDYSDMEKTKAIHDWVCTNILYDVKTYQSGNTDNLACDALSVIHTKSTICEGYSNLTAALNRAAGIKSKVIIGTDNTGAGHAWNETFIDGSWILQDTTWDAGGITKDGSFEQQLSDKYFNPNEKTFDKDHVKQSERQ